MTDKCIIPPFGVHGAPNAAGNHFIVVRDGEFIGFVTRDTILRALHEGTVQTNREEESDS